MSVYLLHDRKLKIYRGKEISEYPAIIRMGITLLPSDAFGIENGNYRTTIKKDAEFHCCIDERDGSVTYKQALLNKLSTRFEFRGFYFELDGNLLKVTVKVQTLEEMLQYVTSANQIIPALVSFYSQSFVWISSFTVSHENGLYHFFVSRIRPPIAVTSEDKATSHIYNSCANWLQINEGQERFIIALYYYRQALRLSRIEPAPQTLIPEVILNLTKALEIIFSDDRDRFRKMALEAGLDGTFIESKLMPLLLLRSKLGIAHVSTSPLTLKQKDMVQQFAISAFNNVQFAINIISEKVRAGGFKLEPISTEMKSVEKDLLDKIAEYIKLPDKEPI